jgi:hypothetical protein
MWRMVTPLLGAGAKEQDMIDTVAEQYITAGQRNPVKMDLEWHDCRLCSQRATGVGDIQNRTVAGYP